MEILDWRMNASFLLSTGICVDLSAAVHAAIHSLLKIINFQQRCIMIINFCRGIDRIIVARLRFQVLALVEAGGRTGMRVTFLVGSILLLPATTVLACSQLRLLPVTLQALVHFQNPKILRAGKLRAC